MWQVVKLLLKNKVKKDAKGDEGQQALHMAAALGHLEVRAGRGGGDAGCGGRGEGGGVNGGSAFRGGAGLEVEAGASSTLPPFKPTIRLV